MKDSLGIGLRIVISYRKFKVHEISILVSSHLERPSFLFDFYFIALLHQFVFYSI